MREDLLHYLWRLRRFDQQNLITTTGESVQIQQTGMLNTHAGPDFSNARIRIGETLWAGNVEMHLYASDWLSHRHQEDRAYDNVILHVVLDEDQPIFRKTGERIPCLELKEHIPLRLTSTYQKLLHNEHWIPCQHHFHTVNEMTKNMWLDRLLVERLENKTTIIGQILADHDNNWEVAFYQVLARNFGLKVNALPFELLAQRTPLKVLAKHKNFLFQIEALLFGQAGMLTEDVADDYAKRLKKEYGFLRKKYDLIPLKKEIWKFMRMRPANFPTIRIAQFAYLIYRSQSLFSKVLEVKDLKEIYELFKVDLHHYWKEHYRFDQLTKIRNKTLGKTTINLLIINTIAPFMFLYGKLRGGEDYKDKALELLEQLPPEKNSIIDRWQGLGMEVDSAYQTQSLLQLKNEYCSRKRCLECAVGNAILR
ncbi:MAG: DUF2851 family protein [Saprospiraceae bacterium]